MKKFYLKGIVVTLVGLTAIALQANTDYRVVNSMDKNISVKLISVSQEVGNFDMGPGEIKTVTTNLANCLDQVLIDLHDGKGFHYIGGAICAGSVACITDYNGIQAGPRPYYGQKSKDAPCDLSKIGGQATTGSAGGALVAGGGTAGAGVLAGAAAADKLAIVASTQATIEAVADAGYTAAVAPQVAAVAGEASTLGAVSAAAIPVGLVVGIAASGAVAGCLFANAFVEGGMCTGSGAKLSAGDWQEPNSTIASRRAKQEQAIKDELVHQAQMKAASEQGKKDVEIAMKGMQAFQDAQKASMQAYTDAMNKEMQSHMKKS